MKKDYIQLIYRYPETLKMLNENWDLLAPYFLDCNYTLPREKYVEVAKLIRNHYFG